MKQTTRILFFLLCFLLSVSFVAANDFRLITWECIFCEWSWVGNNPDRKQACPKLVNGIHCWEIKEITIIKRGRPVTARNDLSSTYHSSRTGSVK